MVTTTLQAPLYWSHKVGYIPPMSNWYVYLLHCADDTLYCGITTDVERRLDEHNKGTGAKYTRSRTPVSLAAFTEVENRSTALKLEINVKKQSRSNKLNYLNSYKKSQS